MIVIKQYRAERNAIANEYGYKTVEDFLIGEYNNVDRWENLQDLADCLLTTKPSILSWAKQLDIISTRLRGGEKKLSRPDIKNIDVSKYLENHNIIDTAKHFGCSRLLIYSIIRGNRKE